MEVLLSLSITLIIVTSLTGFYRLVSHSQKITQYEEDIYIAAKQVSQYVLGTEYISVGDTYKYIALDGEEMCFEFNNNRLVKTPGFEIMVGNIEALDFDIVEDKIYMILERNEKEYRFLLTYAKEEVVEEEPDEEIPEEIPEQ